MICIIHGAYGHPEENWFSRLKTELTKFGQHIVVPEFPTPKNQNLDTWMKILNKYLPLIDKDTIFIGT